jgi:hypothetical protein
MSALRRAAWLVAPVLAGALALGGGAAEGQDQGTKVCGPSSQAVLKIGSFTVINLPPGLEQITAHAAGGTDGQLVLASDGRKVMRSVNGGCNWKQVYDASSAAGDISPKVTQLLLPESGKIAYMILDGPAGTPLNEALLYSPDGGETWGPRNSGLPPAGRYKKLYAAPDNPNALYLVVTVGEQAGVTPADPAGVTGSLYGSDNGGESWTQRSSGVAIDSLAIDPIQSTQLYVVRANHAVELSVDAGQTFKVVPTPPEDNPDAPLVPGQNLPQPAEPWREIAVAHKLPFNATIALLATNGSTGSVQRGAVTSDGGKNWQNMSVNDMGPVGGLHFGRSRTQMYYAAGSDSTAFHGPGFFGLNPEKLEFVNIDDHDFLNLRDPQIARVTAGGPERYRGIFMRRHAPQEDPPLPDAIVRFDPPAPPPGEDFLEGKPCSDAFDTDPGKIDRPQVDFGGTRLDVNLQPNVPLRADLKAKVPPAPSPLDVYFLIDQSTSMDPAIEGLFCSIGRMARELPRKGIDVNFGLAGYSDYYLKTYQRYLDISPPGPAIGKALQTMFTVGGVHEPIRGALFQTATGAGLDVSARDPNDDDPQDIGEPSRVDRKVPPGQQANFRENALRIVLLIGDEPYEEDTEGEPTRDEVVRALKDKKAQVVGIQVLAQFDTNTLRPNDEQNAVRRLILRQQMEYFAKETGAIAPRGGIDCDGGGAPDVQAGAPLVCSIRENGIQKQIDETLLTILRGVEDKQTIKIVPGKSSGLNLAVEGGESGLVNIKKPNEVGATGVLSCTDAQVGRKFDISFDVIVAGRTVGSLPGQATCGTVEEPAAVPPVVAKPRAAKPSPSKPAPVKPAPEPAAAPAVPAPPAPPASPQIAVSAPPPPPPPAPAPAGNVQIQSASAPANAVAPAPGQGAAAAEEQKQINPQVALARSDGGEGRAPLSTEGHPISGGGQPGSGPAGRPGEYFMVARKRDPVPVPALVTLGLGGAGAFLWVAAGAARRRRRELELTPARIDRR